MQYGGLVGQTSSKVSKKFLRRTSNLDLSLSYVLVFCDGEFDFEILKNQRLISCSY